MKTLRAYYSETIETFLSQSAAEILGIIHRNCSSADVTIQQKNTWTQEVEILKRQLVGFREGRIFFEYTIPRMGKRVDVVVLHKNIVFLLEFKCGDREYRTSTVDQVYDYALDLRNFQKESHNKLIANIIVSTNAPAKPIVLVESERIIEPIFCNAENIRDAIKTVAERYEEAPFDYLAWEESEYLPTPTIVEAAQALYRGHNVHEITRSDAGAENLTVTTDAINDIIAYSKANHRKSICFVTGVPGAGKTLVGLNIAIQHANAAKGEHAVFLSGNFPLVDVLQEALARDKVERARQMNERVSKRDALRSTSAFIQIIHKYRDSFVGNDNVPPERVAIFDEAQRAWAKEQIANFMAVKKGVHNFPYSEPEFLIGTMDRHQDWAVVICLVGGGQEINKGEAGLPEWFDSLKRAYPHWNVYLTPQLNDSEYRRTARWEDMIEGLRVTENKDLHLSTSIRSFRTPDLAAFVKAVLDIEVEKAKRTVCKDKRQVSDSFDSSSQGGQRVGKGALQRNNALWPDCKQWSLTFEA